MVRRHDIVSTGDMRPDEFASSFQPEAGSACSDFCNDDKPQALTVTTWARIKRHFHSLWVKSLRPSIRRTP